MFHNTQHATLFLVPLFLHPLWYLFILKKPISISFFCNIANIACFDVMVTVVVVVDTLRICFFGSLCVNVDVINLTNCSFCRKDTKKKGWKRRRHRR